MPSARNTTTRLSVDPGVPLENPTTSFWQQPLHPLASTASPQLPGRADVLIIGSGITGCSVAKTLLEQHDSLTVTVLEARALASGASSRNGGHIVSPSFGDFPQLVNTFGAESAVEIAEFTHKNVDATFQAVEDLKDSDLAAASEIRRTEKVLALADEEMLERMVTTLKLWNKLMPAEYHDAVRIVGAREAREEYELINAVGAAIGKGAAVWPYRLWTGIWDVLSKRYQGRLSIETFTPALSISEHDGPDKYQVDTPRGPIRAAHVVYATNGFTSHLLPALQDKMFPVRGTMSTQDLGKDFANEGADRSWSFLSKSRYDPKSGTANAGLYYLTQNPKSGYMFLGGEHDSPTNIVCSDDRDLSPMSVQKISQILPENFAGVRKDQHKIVSVWSGIMGFSKDGIPLVGRVPGFVTPRRGGQEWIAAGFNGYGTGYCFLCGQAVGEMIIGKEVHWLPKAFMVSEERFRGSLLSSDFWADLIGSLEHQS